MGNNTVPRRYVRILTLLLGLLVLVAAPPQVRAHGGTVRVNGNFGPYHIVAVTSTTAEASDLLLTVVVTGVDTGGETLPPAIVGATVTAQLSISPTGQSATTYVLPPEPVLADSGYYETVVKVPGDGTWQLALQVTGEAGAATTAFPVVLRRPTPQIEWLGWGAALLPLIVGIGLFIFLLRKPPPPPEADELLPEEE